MFYPVLGEGGRDGNINTGVGAREKDGGHADVFRLQWYVSCLLVGMYVLNPLINNSQQASLSHTCHVDCRCIQAL